MIDSHILSTGGHGARNPIDGLKTVFGCLDKPSAQKWCRTIMCFQLIGYSRYTVPAYRYRQKWTACLYDFSLSNYCWAYLDLYFPRDQRSDATMAKHAYRWLLICSSALMFACSSMERVTPPVIDGTATYRERIALPAGAVFEATLEDVSRANAAATAAGTVRFETPPGPPIRFSIAYDPKRIDTTHRYAVHARIVHADRLLFTTDTHYPVLTHGAPATVEVLLRRVSSGPASSEEPTGRTTLQGMYTYRADAGWFTQCGSGRRLLVAQEGDNAALEAAYARAEHEPGAAMRVVVEGRIEEREPMEGPSQPMLIVDRFLSIDAETCEGGGVTSLGNPY